MTEESNQNESFKDEYNEATNSELVELRKQFEALLLGDALDADEKNALSGEILKIIYCDAEEL
jgi:hypothetical protein